MKVYMGPYPEGNEDREIDIEIHDYDVWGMDHTLGLIVLPMLRKLRERKQGSAMVDNEDLPEHLRHNNWSSNESQQLDLFASDEYDELVWDSYVPRWDWVMDEMIWAFEQLDQDWESQYWLERPELDWDDLTSEWPEGQKTREVKWIKEGVCDWDGRRRHQERMQNGFRLFGKYFQALWD